MCAIFTLDAHLQSLGSKLLFLTVKMASQLPPGTDLCAIPAGAPPDGQLPNLVNPETLETSLVVVSSVMTAWAALFTSARIFTNKRKLKAADCEYFWRHCCILSNAHICLFQTLSW